MKKNNLEVIINKIINFVPSKMMVILIFTILILFISLNKFKIDNDFWFLINTGKYILNNGIPIIEPFTIHTNLEFVAQQWLTDVIFYLIHNNFGVYGMYIFITLMSILIVMLIYKISLLVSDNNIKLSIIATLIIYMLLNIDFITTRPQIFDITLLLTEIYLLELYIKRNKKIFLIGLPIISILMINLHSSLWTMIFVFLLPYYVENIKFFKKDKYKLKPIVLTTIVMFLVGFINPYGIEAIEYLFKSFGVDTINKLVIEMQPASKSIKIAIFVYMTIMLLFSYFNKKDIKLRYLFLIIGTSYLGLSHHKGLMFFMICSILPFCNNLKNILKEETKQRKFEKTKLFNVIIVSFFIICFGKYIYNFYKINLNLKTKPALYEIANYLDNNTTKDIKLYTSYNDGGYLEYRGYKCYLDPRAEVFIKENNKKEDILLEYYQLQKLEINAKDFLDKYNFDYLLVSQEDILYYSLETNGYHKVYEQEIDMNNDNTEYMFYAIYKKIQY